MSKVREAFASEEVKRAERLANQRRVVCPEGDFVYVHHSCLDSTMIRLEENNLLVYPRQVEEYVAKDIMEENKLDSLGDCDLCEKELSRVSSSYYRLWVLTKSDYEKNKKYRDRYTQKKQALEKKNLRHQRWQNILRKTPYKYKPIVYWLRKWVYRIVKD